MTELLFSASFLAGLFTGIALSAGIALGYLLASKRASEREHPVEFSGSLDLDPSQRARLYEGRQ